MEWLIEIKQKEAEYKNYINEHIKTVKKVWKEFDGLLGNGYFIDDWSWEHTNQLIKKHDLSKFDKQEFDAYRMYFFPTEKDLQRKEYNKTKFDFAWNQHQKKNPHHWEYWLMGDGKILPMDFPYILEMLCDWVSMSLKFKNKPSDWFDENVSKMKLHGETIKSIDCWLPLFDKVYEKEGCE